MEQVKRISKVSTGHILEPQDFLNIAIDKDLAQELLNGLEGSGLLRVCSFKYKGFYHNICLEFFEHARIEDNVIVSTVNDEYVEVNISDIRELFGFSLDDLPFEDHAFEFDDFWKIVRKNANDDRPKFSGFKYNLKWEFENLADVIQRCVYNLFGSIEKLSVKYARGLHAVYYGVKLDWSKTIFDRLCTFVRDKGHVGYGFLVGELLRKKRLRLGACRNVTNYNYVLRKEKKRKATLIGEMQQGEGSGQASTRRRTNVVCEDLNIPVPDAGGRVLDIVVHGDRAIMDEQGRTLDQIFESVGLNTPRSGVDQEMVRTNVESTSRGITREEIQTMLQEDMVTGLESIGLPCVEPVVEELEEPVIEPVGEPLVEPLMEPVEEATEETLHEENATATAPNTATATNTATASASLENVLTQHFDDFQNLFDELKDTVENSQHSFGDKLQILEDKFTNLEKKVTRINPALREEVNALKIELNVALQKERTALAELVQTQKVETSQLLTRLRAMSTHQMEQLEKVKNTLIEKENAHNLEMQNLREEVATVYGTCDSMATLLQNVLGELRDIKEQQVKNTSLAQEIRTQQKGDAHLFPKILDAAKKGEKGNQFGGSSSQGERITTSFKSFSNPTGNVFSTFSAPKVTSQPESPGLTEQEKEERMVDLFAAYLNVAHNTIIDKEGRNPRECARWYLRDVFPANDIRDAVECYRMGRVLEQFYHSDDKGDFGKLRKRINDMLGI